MIAFHPIEIDNYSNCRSYWAATLPAYKKKTNPHKRAIYPSPSTSSRHSRYAVRWSSSSHEESCDPNKRKLQTKLRTSRRVGAQKTNWTWTWLAIFVGEGGALCRKTTGQRVPARYSGSVSAAHEGCCCTDPDPSNLTRNHIGISCYSTSTPPTRTDLMRTVPNPPRPYPTRPGPEPASYLPKRVYLFLSLS